MDSEMSDGTPVSPELDARMLAHPRAWRARHVTGLRRVTLTSAELDMLLRVAAERDKLKAAACEMPDERPSNVTPIGREAKIHGEFVTMRVDEWRRLTDELTRLRTAEAARIDAALEEDERVIAWDQIAAHPFFRDCYGTETSLVEAMLAKLTASTFEAEIPDEIRERAGEPVTDERPRCDVCSSVIVPDRFSTSGWRHEIRPMRLHVAWPDRAS